MGDILVYQQCDWSTFNPSITFIYVQVSESAFFDSDTLYDGLLEGIRVSEALTPTPGSQLGSQLAKRFTS